MQMQTAVAARKERRRRERLEKKGKEAARRAAAYLKRILILPSVNVWLTAKKPDCWSPLFKWGLWQFGLQKRPGIPGRLYGIHPRWGWAEFAVSEGDLKEAGFVLGEAGTNV